MHKVIIDTDIGDDVDDAYAVAFALMRPEIDVLALTTSYGPTLRRLQILNQLVRTVRRNMPLPPMAAGDGMPLTPASPERRNAIMDAVPNQHPFSSPAATPAHGAAMLMDAIIRSNPGEVTLITIGAMTNVARLLRNRPDVAPMIRGIASMGGRFSGEGAEYNIKCDPIAAADVLASGIPSALFSWEVTRRIVLDEPEMTRLRDADTPVTRALVELSELWWPHRGWKPGPVIYDMCPLLHLFQPEMFTMAAHDVSVTTKPGDDIGRTRLSNGTRTLVSTDMDVPGAAAVLMDTICAPA